MKKYVLVLLIICTTLFSCMVTAFAWDETFSDDFSSGNLDKWTGDTVSLPIEDGMVGLNVFNVHLIPKDFEPSKNIMFQFDAICWHNNFYVQFTDPADASNTFRTSLREQTDYAQVWDTGDTWVSYGTGCSVSGGTVIEPKINSVRFTLIDGVLSIYIKTENDTDFVYKGSHSYEANDGVISGTASYIPGFYVIGSQDASKAGEFKIDNVIIKTLQPFEPELSAQTIDTRPGAKLGISFDYAIDGVPTTSNISLEKEDGMSVAASVVPVTPTKYNLVLPDDTWLTEGEKLNVIFKNLRNIHGQILTEKTVEITAAAYDTDFTVGELSKVVGDAKTPLTSLEQGTFTLSATLLPNKPHATVADMIIMVCKGTEEKYSLSDIYYYNDVAAFGEKTAELTIGEGEFIKLMSVYDFADGRLSADSAIINQ